MSYVVAAIIGAIALPFFYSMTDSTGANPPSNSIVAGAITGMIVQVVLRTTGVS